MRTHPQMPSSSHIQSQHELPQDQPPEQLVWDDNESSPSTSVRTPDSSESLEVDMLHSGPISNYNFNGNMSTQSSHNVFTARGTFSDQGLLNLCASSPISANTQSAVQAALPTAYSTATVTSHLDSACSNQHVQPKLHHPITGRPSTLAIVYRPSI
jgi:hypothetical protein